MFTTFLTWFFWGNVVFYVVLNVAVAIRRFRSPYAYRPNAEVEALINSKKD